MSTGLTTGALDDTVVLSWNKPEFVENYLRRHHNEVACVITEPVMGNNGVIEPQPGYLQFLRDITRELDVLLIFDEVISGFRVAAGGGQERYGVVPDLCTMAKALGVGFPLAALGGSAEVMDLMARNDTFHGGTYAGNPLVLAASHAGLSEIKENKKEIYSRLEHLTERAMAGLKEILDRYGFHYVANGAPGMFQFFLTREPVEQIINYRDAAMYSDTDLFREWQHALQANGIYVHPSQYECFFISTVHTAADIDEALEKADKATRELRDSR
jgi:glutamate-1-semialdehyde 2,1-aminomutase